MEHKFCQSCAMPMKNPEEHGTNKDNTLNEDYCCYCYQAGEFLQKMTMNEMIMHCAEMVDEFNKDSEIKLTKEEAVAQMSAFFPTLKRWQ